MATKRASQTVSRQRASTTATRQRASTTATRQRTPTTASRQPASTHTAVPDAHPHVAAHRAVASTSTKVRLPVLGDVTLPPAQHLAWYAGITALAAVEIIEWPVAVVLALGKALADDRNNRTVEAFGEALEEGI